jgi:acyl-CoA dehydrogenase
MYLSGDPGDPVGRLEHALDAVIAAEPLERKLLQSAKLRFDYARPEETLDRALAARALDETEAATLREAARAMRRAIDVDAFPAGSAPVRAAATGHAREVADA